MADTRAERLAKIEAEVERLIDEIEECVNESWQSEDINQFWSLRKLATKNRLIGYVGGIAAVTLPMEGWTDTAPDGARGA